MSWHETQGQKQSFEFQQALQQILVISTRLEADKLSMRSKMFPPAFSFPVTICPPGRVREGEESGSSSDGSECVFRNGDATTAASTVAGRGLMGEDSLEGRISGWKGRRQYKMMFHLRLPASCCRS